MDTKEIDRITRSMSKEVAMKIANGGTRAPKPKTKKTVKKPKRK